MTGIKCRRCRREAKKLKQAPFSETFYGTRIRKQADTVGLSDLLSACPECMEKWKRFYDEKKHEFETEMDRVKYYFMRMRRVPERAICKKHNCWGHIEYGKLVCVRCNRDKRGKKL